MSSACIKNLGLTPDIVDSAKTSLLEFVKIEEGIEAKSSEIVVKENMSFTKFLHYRERDLRLPVRLYLCDGKIIINEVCTATRSMVSAIITILMFKWNNHDLDYGGDANMILDANSVKEPNSWVRPVGRIPNSDNRSWLYAEPP